ncbi:ParA family protein [Halarchaeum sp. P4]|uniref:ParA family protein n=1 Tax=Halarchaeum sp. P4 TaxID=3421639 RepID=UPI003EB6C4E5
MSSTDSTPRAVSVSILKGGVGKSTIAVNLADRIAARGNDVLFIDLDPNGHASMGLGFEDVYQQGSPNVGDVVLDDGDADPEDVIHESEFGFDVLPSSRELERVEDRLRNSMFSDVRLRRDLVEPLLSEDEYDFVVTDSPAYRGKLADNALVATQNLIIPLTPGNEALAGFERTFERQIKPIREQIGLDILAVVPNRLSSRIDQQNGDRLLVEDLNRNFAEYVPEFARIEPEEFDRIDAGEHDTLPKPGIRDRGAFTKAFGEEMPLAHYDPNNDQVEHLDSLAALVEEEVGR